MKFYQKTFYNWGRNININPKIIIPKNIQELKKTINKKTLLVTGNQRSFGDVALNGSNLISMKNFNRIIDFNPNAGVISLESGVILKDILPILIEKGLMFPVTPGTKYVTIGGMIANNIHGKNSNKNQIRFYITQLKLLLANKKIVFCTPKVNKKLFNLTIGGFGLTGIIISATFKLKKVSSSFLNQKIFDFSSYEQFFNHSKKISKYDYSVSWIENFTNKKISGLWILSNHSKSKIKYSSKFKEKKIGIIYKILLNLIISSYFFSRISNFLYKIYQKYFYTKIISYDKYLYPQDRFIDWNLAYGRRGFFQLQFIVEKKNLIKILSKFYFFFKTNNIFSNFVVIKKINEKGHYLNFAGKGFTVSMDIKINSKFNILKEFINQILFSENLKVNIAKDLITDKENVSRYNNFLKFKKDLSLFNRKKKLNSFLSKRINL